MAHIDEYNFRLVEGLENNLKLALEELVEMDKYYSNNPTDKYASEYYSIDRPELLEDIEQCKLFLKAGKKLEDDNKYKELYGNFLECANTTIEAFFAFEGSDWWYLQIADPTEADEEEWRKQMKEERKISKQIYGKYRKAKSDLIEYVDNFIEAKAGMVFDWEMEFEQEIADLENI